ncbi:MFS transporter [Amycolatopsis jejuensis]|uniref:MFS transporter n=1 Tax=Amycolatopsis jejuensis TaxID=330084 RepID=UPI00068F3600|nr:MFS transporter [Amycolatopsis jejuensis]
MSARGVGAAALIGTTIEFYDFFVFGTTVVLVLGSQFFPASDPLTSSLLAFSTLGAGFLTRPLGGLLFAHFGDRAGRKKTLVVSLLMMGLATSLVGLIPTYDRIGIWAPIILVALRLVQGLAVGGEWGGAVLLAVEHAPRAKRAFYGSLPQFGSPLGLLLSSAVIALFQLMPAEAYRAWGWRVPFLLSIVLLLVGLVVRLRIEESASFVEAKARDQVVSVPVVSVVKQFWRVVLVGTGVTVIAHSLLILVNFLPSYAKSRLGVPASAGTNGLVIASAAAVLALAVVIRLLDGRDRRKFAALGGLLTAAWAFPGFLLTVHWGTAGLIIALTVGYVLLMGHYGALSSLLADLFPTHLRYSGISLCYQLSAIVGGSLLPLLTSYLVERAGGAYWPAAALLAASGVVTLVASLLARPVPTTGTDHPLPTGQQSGVVNA